MLQLEQGRAQVLSEVHSFGAESVLVAETAGRILAERIVAPISLPAFDNSAMDGYAVRAEDILHASATSPVTLRVCGRVEAGTVSEAVVEPGTCMRIFTGAPLPPGADAVIMQEDTQRGPQTPDRALMLTKVARGENVRQFGEDVREGQELFAAGDRLSVGGVGLLAALGFKEVAVGRAPVVAIMATGSELKEPEEPLTRGAIYESNRSLLRPLVLRAGGIPKVYPIIADDLKVTEEAMKSAFEQCDVLITTGGVSVGELDMVKEAFSGIGGNLEMWKLAIKPGKPFAFGRLGPKLFFGLPGNPVSALVTFVLLVWPALLRCQGATNVDLPRVRGVLADALANPSERRHFVRVQVDDRGSVHNAGAQASHVLSALAKANGLVDMPPRSAWEAGEVVEVLRFDWQVF